MFAFELCRITTEGVVLASSMSISSIGGAVFLLERTVRVRERFPHAIMGHGGTGDGRAQCKKGASLISTVPLVFASPPFAFVFAPHFCAVNTITQ